MANLESTKLERLRVIRDADFVDRFEEAGAELTITPAVDESVTGGADFNALIDVTAAVDESVSIQRVGRIIDGFEDGDLSEYSGDVSNPDVTVQGNVVDDGTYALQIPSGGTGTSDSTIVYSLDGDGLPIYPKPGDVFETSIYFGDDFDPDPFFGFGVQGFNSFYFVRIGAAEQDFAVGINDAGTETEFENVSAAITDGTWYTIEVTWKANGFISAELFDSSGSSVAFVSGSDTTFSDGGVAFGDNQDFETT